jgi:hypothetical protein
MDLPILLENRNGLQSVANSDPPVDATTFNIMTLSITTLSALSGFTTRNITVFTTMTQHNDTLSLSSEWHHNNHHNDTQYNDTLSISIVWHHDTQYNRS